MKAIKYVALAALLGSAAAFAQSTTPSQTDPNRPMDQTTPSATTTAKPDFNTLDANRDGKISKDEAKQNSGLNSQFKDLDADKNGSLSMSEFSSYSTDSSSSTKKDTTTPDSTNKY